MHVQATFCVQQSWSPGKKCEHSDTAYATCIGFCSWYHLLLKLLPIPVNQFSGIQIYGLMKRSGSFSAFATTALMSLLSCSCKSELQALQLQRYVGMYLMYIFSFPCTIVNTPQPKTVNRGPNGLHLLYWGNLGCLLHTGRDLYSGSIYIYIYVYYIYIYFFFHILKHTEEYPKEHKDQPRSRLQSCLQAVACSDSGWRPAQGILICNLVTTAGILRMWDPIYVERFAYRAE